MRILIMLSLLMYASLGQAAVTTGTAPGTSRVFDQKIDAQLIVSDFMQQVDDGEVSLFGVALSRDMLAPVRVSREYQFENDNTTIMIYSRLTQPLPMPQATQYTVVGISVMLTPTGEINEIKAHVRGQ